MSLYNTLFGVNEAAPYLLSMLGITAVQVPRFRDCFLKGNAIVIYTRTGGGNRVEYEERNAWLRKVPGFLCDHDDCFDSTFAYFSYAIPERYATTCEIMRQTMAADRDPAVEWPRLLAKLQDPAQKDDPEVVAVLERMRPTMEKIQKSFEGDGPKIIEV